MANEFNGVPARFGARVPDIFVDEVTGFDMINGTLRLDLATAIRAEPIPSSDVEIAVIGRLIMPIEVAQRLSIGLYDYLKKQGLDPNSAAGAPSEPADLN